MKKKSIIIITIACAAVLGILYGIWHGYAASTRIAFVNYQAIALGQIGKANDNSFVKIS